MPEIVSIADGDEPAFRYRAMADEYADKALDWPVEYWASSGDTSTEFVCGSYEPMSRPDRRCKTGIRTWNEPCHHVFPDWATPRKLLAAAAAHIAEAHKETAP